MEVSFPGVFSAGFLLPGNEGRITAGLWQGECARRRKKLQPRVPSTRHSLGIHPLPPQGSQASEPEEGTMVWDQMSPGTPTAGTSVRACCEKAGDNRGGQAKPSCGKRILQRKPSPKAGKALRSQEALPVQTCRLWTSSTSILGISQCWDISTHPTSLRFKPLRGTCETACQTNVSSQIINKPQGRRTNIPPLGYHTFTAAWG